MKNTKLITLAIAVLVGMGSAFASPYGDKILINNDWRFSLGHASDFSKDFGHGTEYFTYFTKARSNNENHGPASVKFDDSSWQKVSLPHDWVVDLGYSGEASHSHGYKCVGWKYPENSVGWYRKKIFVPEEDKGKQIWIEFEGVFREGEVFCNGYYLGHERSGYSSVVYDLSHYLEYGKENLITVRCDASLEEGWYYEGAGIYRNVYLHKAGPVALKPYSLSIVNGKATYELVYSDYSVNRDLVSVKETILDAEGNTVSEPVRKWSLEDRYLYTYHLQLFYDGKLSAEYFEKFGVRDIEFNSKEGFLLNGKKVDLKGCDLHLDHAGVGVAVPDELWRYKILELKKYGFNAIRCSHNPASPSMLDACDELGMLVIDENREIGVNEEQLRQVKNLVDRDRNHPCVILWSIGNEEWAVENNPEFVSLSKKMSDYINELDPTRPTTYGSSGGREFVKGVNVFGYNYVRQNPILDYQKKYPEKTWVATEETSGCGTRGKYETVPEEGWMMSFNRSGVEKDFANGSDAEWEHKTADGNTLNVIERGWKFYLDNPWMGGVFYWTGFDYRGEPNPMAWPATGSQFGILDYCGFPKDEAFYLQSAWTDEPMVHICAPCNGEVWVYSNCETVELYADGKSLGRKTVSPAGHLWWKVKDGVKSFKAKGVAKVSGKKVTKYDYCPEKTELLLAESVQSGETIAIGNIWVRPSKKTIKADGQDVVILDVFSAGDMKLDVRVDGAEFLGWGNGNPGFKEVERPVSDSESLSIKTFSGRAQIIVRSVAGSSGVAKVQIGDALVELKLI